MIYLIGLFQLKAFFLMLIKTQNLRLRFYGLKSIHQRLHILLLPLKFAGKLVYCCMHLLPLCFFDCLWLLSNIFIALSLKMGSINIVL